MIKPKLYIEKDKPHCLVWPALAFGWEEVFWIGIGWFNMEIGLCVEKEENHD